MEDADVIGRHAMVPGRKSPSCIESGLEIMSRHWPQPTVMNVVLTGPHNFDRKSGFLRKQKRAQNEILVPRAATTESPTQEHLVKLHVLRFDPERCRCRRHRHRLTLRSAPEVHRLPVRCDGGDRVKRFHLRVIGIVATKFAINDRCGGLQGVDTVTDLVPKSGLVIDFAASDLGILLQCLLAVERRGLRRLLPRDLDSVFGRARRPRRPRHDSDADGQPIDAD